MSVNVMSCYFAKIHAGGGYGGERIIVELLKHSLWSATGHAITSLGPLTTLWKQVGQIGQCNCDAKLPDE
jgi:hypothetical protein